jgi:hypothetical protein
MCPPSPRHPLAALCLALPLVAAAAPQAPLTQQDEAGSARGEPQVLHQVTEDEQVRIDELRVRGQTRRLSVQPKIKGMPAYELAAPEAGRDPAQDPKAGQRIWFSLTF